MKLIYLINVILVSIIHAEIVEDSVSNALNQFGLKLLAETNSKVSENINLAISPYTVWMAMSIVNEGAMGNTAAQLEKTLHIPASNESDRVNFRKLQQRLVQQITKSQNGVTLEILNSMFTRQEAILKPKFTDLVQDIYKVRVNPLNFNQPAIAADFINNVVSNATHGRLPKIIGAGSVEDAYMFVTSVLFFKGLWDKKFDIADTKEEPFYNERKEQIATVEMMHTNGAFPFGQVLNGKAIAVELPYVGGNTAMLVILPNFGTTLSSIIDEISKTSIAHVTNTLNGYKEKFGESDVLVSLPKFKIASELNLVRMLRNMGVKDVFDIASANLTGMSTASLFVTNILHKTEIEVDEDGTTGSAATVLEIVEKSATPNFDVNRPFVFIVIDKITATAIFLGTVNNPAPSLH